MYGLLRDMGTSFYLHRSLQKTASRAKNAVGYLLKKGALQQPAADHRIQQQQQQQRGLSAGDVAIGAGGIAAGVGGGALAGNYAYRIPEKIIHGRAVERAFSDPKLDVINLNGETNRGFIDSAKRILYDRNRIAGDTRSPFSILDSSHGGNPKLLEDYKRVGTRLNDQIATNVSRAHRAAMDHGLSLGANWTPEQNKLFDELMVQNNARLQSTIEPIAEANARLDKFKKFLKPMRAAGAIGGGLLAGGLLYNHFKNRNQEPTAEQQ